MEIKAIFEKGYFNVYDSQSQIIGKIKIDSKLNFKESKIIIGNEQYKVIRDSWDTTILKNNEPLYHLKTDSFSGNTEIIGLNKKIKGVWGLKWGTQLVDENGETLLKIRNEKQLIYNGNYILKLEKEDLTPLEILISFYGHLYGTFLKQKSVLLGILSSN